MPNSVALNVPAFTGDDNAYEIIALPEGIGAAIVVTLGGTSDVACAHGSPMP
jgi:hypothetical protein